MDTDFSSSAIVINTDGMGHGDEGLRHRLLSNYLRTLIELDRPPQSILLYAAGVKMAAATSPCRAELTQLRAAGTQIIACRTCLDHYGLMAQLPGEEIGNMLMIVEAQAAAGKVIVL
ncbi:MAG: hypothetical protein H6R19_1593 [Proteobacteria bacterium]|nr:hypothetical protein [Pseudomonadota bacterium]